MSVIIRLQNLPWSANALDIRGFFRGLAIPDGGVHIVGGEMGDAFIAFSTDEDARQAMMLDRGKINEVQIRLLLSSRAEMQKVIEQARQQSLSAIQITNQTSQVIQQSQQQQSSKSISTPPQPPIITPTSLHNILSQQVIQKPSFTESIPQSSPLFHSSSNQHYSDNSLDSRDDRDRISLTKINKVFNSTTDRDRKRDRDRYGRSSRSRSRSKSRDRDRERRRSKSRDRDRNRTNSTRRRGHRSRTRSPERDRRGSRRRRSSRERDRDNRKNFGSYSRSHSRSRSRSRSYERERDRNKRNDFNNESGNNKDLLNTKRNNKEEIIKLTDTTSYKDNSNIVGGDHFPKVNQWDTGKQDSPTATPSVLTTNYGQGFNMNQTLYPPPAINTSLLNTLQKFSSPSSLQLQQQTQHLIMQQKANAVLPNDQKQLSQSDSLKSMLKIYDHKLNTPPPPLSFHNIFASNLNSSFAFPFLNTKSEEQQPTDPSNNSMKTFLQTPYNVNKSLPTLVTPTNALNPTLDFSGVFGNSRKVLDENNFDQFKKSDISHKDSNLRDPRTLKKTDYTDQKNNYDSSKKGNCIKVTNMCPGTTYSDIRKFFSGLFIANNGIKMLNDVNGQRSGTAFIRFVKEQSKLQALTRNGYMLKNKRIIIESATDAEFNDAVDSYKPIKYNNKYQDNIQNQNESKPTKIIEQEKGKTVPINSGFSVLLLEGVPSFATEQDIMKLFSVYSVIDIILTREETNKKQFIAYVKFHQPEDAKKALMDKQKHTIGHKQITVSPYSDEEYEKFKELHDLQMNNTDDDEYEPKIADDMDTSNSGKIGENKVEEKINKNDESSDENNIENKTDLQVPNHNKSNNNTIIDTSKIPSLLSLDPIPPINNDPRQRNRNMWNNNDSSSGAGGEGRRNRSNDENNKGRYAILKNCDYKSTRMDILQFFNRSANLLPNRIEFLKNNRGQQNGEVVIEFKNSMDAEKSLGVHNAMCNNRRIKIELVSTNFVVNKLGEDFVNKQDCNTKLVDDQNQLQMSTFDFKSSFGGNNLDLKRDLSENIGNNSRQKQSRFLESNENRSNNRYSGGNNNNDKQQYSGGGSHFDKNNREKNLNLINGIISDTAIDRFGKPGCVVSLENIPYKAGVDDILNFFDRFKLKPENFIRRYNDDGKPTGDARVAFHTPFEAQDAIKMKNKQKLFGRTIYLSLV